jgi:hypothetical protein
MADQLSLSEAEYNLKNGIQGEKISWTNGCLVAMETADKRICPNYPKPGNGRKPYPLTVMLQVHYPHLFYNLSDPAMGVDMSASEHDNIKASVRAKVEQPFIFIIKRISGYSKACYG